MTERDLINRMIPLLHHTVIVWTDGQIKCAPLCPACQVIRLSTETQQPD